MNALRIFVATATFCVATLANAATFTIRSGDAANEGLNSTTPFTPVGGNNAATLGEARMNVLQEAARIWGQLLHSNVPILVDVRFDPQTCTSTSGTLGSAGPRAVFRNVAGAASSDTYYVSALADAIAGSNMSSNPSSADIGATFNSALDDDPGCLGGRGFYYGLDHNRGNRVDLLLVVLHELGHGLGFTSQVDLSTGAGFVGGDNVERFESFTHRLFDEQLGAAWPSLTRSQRVASASRTGLLAWNGANVNSQVGRFSAGVTANSRVRMYAPSTVSSGSSVSHFDTVVTPSVLMEPNLPGSISTSSVDITVCTMQDIGWTVSMCPHDATNRAPTAVSQTVTVAEDTSVTITLIGTDPDGNSLSFFVGTPPGLGTLSTISSTAPRTVVYTPNANANGSDSFTFIANDGVLSSAAGTVTINITSVNDAPTAQDTAGVTQSGQSLDVALIGVDIEGDVLTYSGVSNPAHGTISFAGSIVTYRPQNGFVGSDTFTYRVNDGSLNSANATVNITVLAPPQTSLASSEGSGGGGAMSLHGIIALFLIGALRLSRPLSTVASRRAYSRLRSRLPHV